VCAAVLVFNSAYIAAFGSPTLFYVANALLHPLLGIAVSILFIGFVFEHRSSFAGAWGTGVPDLIGFMRDPGGLVVVHEAMLAGIIDNRRIAAQRD
jgi:hypothetical protein